ncbi:MAG TPA: winged helix-turn-helix transcriptional regulator [Spirochaetes bacterium]|nr:winged helix-turn-helix transcriptional regulator [Spirochaetota bacterium]
MNNASNLVEDPLNPKEALVLSKISADGRNSQREISRRSGLSVGLINILIKNLAQKGFVKLSRLNRKNIQYLLTSKGISEQYRLTRLYIQDTFHRINNYKQWFHELIDEYINKRFIQFVIIGDDELSNILEAVLGDYEKASYVKVARTEDLLGGNMLILDCKGDYSQNHPENEQCVHITAYLSKKMNEE